MTSTAFALAQQRIAARRQLRASEAKARQEQRSRLQSSTAFDRLPFPLSRLRRASLDNWDVIKGREGTRPAFRVGQIDAELLDEELLELLKGQVGEALKHFGSHLKDEWSSEILLGLRAVLFKLTIWDHNASYGAALQNLRYIDARNRSPVNVRPSRWQKALYGALTVGGRYAWNKWEDWLVEQEGGYDEPSAKVRLLSRLSSTLSTTHSVAAMFSFLVFLFNGQYRTIIDRVLRLRLAPPSNHVSREVSFEYLNRQLVWHAFTEFLLFLLPLVGISRWRRWLARVWRKTKSVFKKGGGDEEDGPKAGGELAFLPERTCAICYQDQNPTSTSEHEVLAISGASGGVIGSAQTDITNAYETIPCGCIYCFICVAQRLDGEEGEGWICLRCGELVKECKPWSGDVLEEVSRPSTDKSVGFAEEKDINYEMRDVEPFPESDDKMVDVQKEGKENMGSTKGESRALDDSEEWAQMGEHTAFDDESVGQETFSDSHEDIDPDERDH
ncbi:MAG: peroxisome assembly protein (Peroxin-2) [Candelina submexicana]|nr:MAG: peroxisome assembly protein (Peroxin-2) [Candelina submexicana]